MKAADLQLLKANVGRRVILHCVDGEILIAEIHSVSEEDQDVIYDVVSSNRSGDREGVANGPAYLMPFSEVDFVALPPSQGERY